MEGVRLPVWVERPHLLQDAFRPGIHRDGGYLKWIPSKETKVLTVMVMRRVDSKLGGGFTYFLFSPLFGEDSHFD